jgi:hypothetical protein
MGRVEIDSPVAAMGNMLAFVVVEMGSMRVAFLVVVVGNRRAAGVVVNANRYVCMVAVRLSVRLVVRGGARASEEGSRSLVVVVEGTGSVLRDARLDWDFACAARSHRESAAGNGGLVSSPCSSSTADPSCSAPMP